MLTSENEAERDAMLLRFPSECKAAQSKNAKQRKAELPRGIRVYDDPRRPRRPYFVQWRVDGAAKTKAFKTREAQQSFASSLAGEVKTGGLAALRLDEGEAREWRAFRAQVGDADLAAVARHWLRTGRRIETASEMTPAVAEYLVARKAEGLAQTTLWHYRSELDIAALALAGPVSAVTTARIEAWLAAVPVAPLTRRGYLKRLSTFFEWAKRRGITDHNPCDDVVPPRAVQTEVHLYTVAQGTSLFAKNEGVANARELLGRMALEAFAGLRFSSAAKISAADINFAERGIVLPAAKIKTLRRQWIDGLPDNLWAWLEWAKPAKWVMTPRAYLAAKSAARVKAELPEVHNALRHSFCSYHIAAHKDASRTSVLLCHTSPAMLWRHYRGNATQADGLAWFQIMP